MPAKSKSQQRLMQAAEHGASFPMAQKIRSSMTHAQMHDFAVGSEAGKPQHVKPLHPALKAHGAKVAHAHATLVARHGPDFNTLPAPERMRRVQAQIRKKAY